MFAKVFEQIFESTIADDYHIRHVFMDLLVLADQDGVIDKTVKAISRITNVPLNLVQDAINKLCAPDPDSRTNVEGGRRLILIDENRNWGWKIVNYLKYRDIRDEEARRIANRSYKRAQRAKARTGQSVIVSKRPSMSAQAEVEADTEAESKSTPGRDLEDDVREVANQHPKLSHRKNGPTRIEQEAIAQAIAQDGRDLVLAGTRNLADAVAKWPIADRKFIPDAVKFYQREDYKLDPATWDRTGKSTEYQEYLKRAEAKEREAESD